jgi:acyl-coenzyme A synthetase/AMP-(fatty) acid ligase
MGATCMSLTTTVAAHLKPDDCPSLKTLVCGGEPMTRTVMDAWADNVKLIQIYGPAETSVYCCGRVMSSRADE